MSGIKSKLDKLAIVGKLNLNPAEVQLLQAMIVADALDTMSEAIDAHTKAIFGIAKAIKFK